MDSPARLIAARVLRYVGDGAIIDLHDGNQGIVCAHARVAPRVCDRSADVEATLEIEGSGEFPPANAIWNTCGKYRIACKYPNDITMIIAGGHGDIRGGT